MSDCINKDVEDVEYLLKPLLRDGFVLSIEYLNSPTVYTIDFKVRLKIKSGKFPLIFYFYTGIAEKNETEGRFDFQKIG
jgi:hypothetical protein